MYPIRCNQRYSLARWKKLVILAGRFPFPSLCCFWLLGRLCSENSMAKPAALVDNVSLRVFISSHSYVLLVAACPSSSPTVVCIRNTVCHRDHSERHLSLNCEMVILFFAGLPSVYINAQWRSLLCYPSITSDISDTSNCRLTNVVPRGRY